MRNITSLKDIYAHTLSLRSHFSLSHIGVFFERFRYTTLKVYAETHTETHSVDGGE